MTKNHELPWAIIGAGPAGLAAARNLQRLNIPFVGFETHDDVGGLWDATSPTSTMYESAHLISSKRMTEFKEFPMRDEVADYPHHSRLREYFRDFAAANGLYEHYQFKTTVLAAEPNADASEWQLRYESEGKEYTERFAGVLVANGTLHEPNLPEFEGQFSGQLMHSAEYKSADVFEGKRVLIIGAGNSGCDIAVDAVHRAKHVDMSVRRGYHFVPKYVFGKPADSIGGKVTLPFKLKQKVDGLLLRQFTGDPTRFGFPEPDHELYESHPIVNSLILHHLGHGDIRVKSDIDRFDGTQVLFKDGSAEDYDLILLATGYKLHYPFMDKAHLNWKGAAPHLYLNCFHPKYDNLFLMGMVEAAGLGWEGRYEQAELVARYIAAKGTKEAKRFNQVKSEPFPNMSGAAKYIKLDRMAYYVNKAVYRETVKKHIKQLG
ncbi:MAG: NAD(P)-binding domain-containing protein [Gammaproteobacteria bacterium]|nr:NAD(P)-binding domain-containing protein [Gammaproteobacteria bacterium]